METYSPKIHVVFLSIAQSFVKKLEGKRDTSQWKKIYQAYIYAINKYQTPYFGYRTLDNLKDRYEGCVDYLYSKWMSIVL